MSFGEILKDLRKDALKKRAEVASELNIPASTLGNYENNASEPDFETLKLLANYYNVNIDYLLENTRYRSSWQQITTVIKAKSGSVSIDQVVKTISLLSEEEKNAFLFLVRTILNNHGK